MSDSESAVRIATRGSRLALWQAEHIADRLRGVLAHDPAGRTAVELVEVTTRGDANQTDSLTTFGGTGAFTREVQHAVLEHRADLAVHSLKDLPTDPHPGLILAAVPSRETIWDALVLPVNRPDEPEKTVLHPLPLLRQGARVGTGSVRREAQLRYARPDLDIVGIRGNVETRLAKLDAGEFDAIILAVAGLKRLGLGDRITCELQPPLLFPAVSQGALGLDCRGNDTATQSLLGHLIDNRSWKAVHAERAMLRELRAGCHAPVGVHYVPAPDGQTERMLGVVLNAEGTRRYSAEIATDRTDPEAMGVELARRLVQLGAADVLN